MSDAAIATIAACVLQVVIAVCGFLALWVKLRYGQTEATAKATAVEAKLDQNTLLTTDAKDAAQAAREQTNGHLADYDERLADHDGRIKALETQMVALKLSVDVLGKNIDSSRHEMRGSLQTLMYKIDLLAIGKVAPAADEPAGGK